MDTKPMSSRPSNVATGSSNPTSGQHHTAESFLGAVTEHVDEAQRKAATMAKSAARDLKSDAKSVARELQTEASDVMTKVREGARIAYDDVVELGSHLPEKVNNVGRSIDAHVHQHPRMDLVIVGGASAILGAFFGGRIVRLALFACAAYGLTRLYPQIERLATSRSGV
jgi:flagellar hook-basal body complex protein FliE